MAQDKQLARLEAKLDALLEKSGLDPEDFGPSGGKTPPRQAAKLTAAQQQAIDNAPKYVEAKATGSATQGVPETPPANQPATVPPDAVGDVTVQTTEPSGEKKVETKPASRVK